MKNIKNIIFDFDGVLLRNTKLMFKINQETLGDFTWDNFKDSFNGNTLDYYRDVSKKNIEFFYRRWSEVLKNEKIDNESINFLIKNKEKRKFIISSNKENILNKIINNSNLKNVFLKIMGKETNTSKIKKFLILKKEYNINFNETLFITDSLGDLKEASAFPELKTIGVTWGVHDKDRLKDGSPNLICDSWEEIEDKIR